MVYNNPFTTGIDLSVAFLAKLAALPNVTMIKESSPDITKIARLRDACSDKTAHPDCHCLSTQTNTL